MSVLWSERAIEELGGAGPHLGGRQGTELSCSGRGLTFHRLFLVAPSLRHSIFLDVNFLIMPCIPAVLTALQWLSSGWKCARCDLRENLWLNLTDGSVLCGKWFFDSSGGNGHALEHYRDMGYPLAVKLGTITPDGAGEYACTPLGTCSASLWDLTSTLILGLEDVGSGPRPSGLNPNSVSY